MTQQTLWTDRYESLQNDWGVLVDAMTEAGKKDGATTTSAYTQADAHRLQLEYQINQHIESAYHDPVLNDLYHAHKDDKFDIDWADHDGIIYNNAGLPLTGDSGHWRGKWFDANQEFTEVLDEYSADYDAGTSLILSKLLDPKNWFKFPQVRSIDGTYDYLTQAHFEAALGEALPDFGLGQQAWEAFKDGLEFDARETPYDVLGRDFFGSPPSQRELDSVVQQLSESPQPGILERFSDQLDSWADDLKDTVDGFISGVGKLDFDSLSSLLNLGSFRGDLTGIQGIADAINDLFAAAQSWRPRRRNSPIALDLDNDGLETTAESGWSGPLFDHNGDGIKQATGWLSADDALLVLDRNGNGLIDNGQELFGDSTPLQGGGTAEHGYTALAELDGNGDGVVDASDAQFADLRLWRDLNQDGISQANELSTLDELGVASIDTAFTTTNILNNGNRIPYISHFTRADGSTGTTGDIFFAISKFHTEFAAPVEPTALTRDLPDFHGSGAVRNLRDAASRSDALASVLTQYSTANRDGQMELIDTLISTWAATSGMKSMVDRAEDENSIVLYEFGNQPSLSDQEVVDVIAVMDGNGGSSSSGWVVAESDNSSWMPWTLNRGRTTRDGSTSSEYSKTSTAKNSPASAGPRRPIRSRPSASTRRCPCPVSAWSLVSATTSPASVSINVSSIC